ncbi:unnamed protein product [Oikopleura dioica]|uniref:D-lactate dehydrogenase (cytochrome) n=1 Tax=Oikopleura dioica TaxID=34765 RepID=E4YB27_OIKDI|nr:unnamed protein product [Oikopleura dioica]
MNEILFVSEEDLYCVVQPGVTREQLNEHLRATGLFFPVDPGANASLGGMAATSASGTSAVRFGTMKENVINMEVVLPSGEILHTSGEGRSFRKSSAGLNLTELFVGSEGTLGMITQLTLRLHPQPESTIAAVCQFDSVSGRVLFIDFKLNSALQYNIPLAKVELLDSRSIQAVNDYSKTALEEKPTLFLEFQGSESAITEQRTMFFDIAEENRSISWKQADTLEERNSLWKARHSLWFAFLSQELCDLDGEGWRGYSTDVCVPISKLDEMIKAAEKIMKGTYAEDIFAFLGHVGDGNFHIFIPVNDETFSELNEISHKVGLAALELGGTCTGEHGVGIGKQQLMALERGAVALDLMKTIKKSVDEKNLMNPGKVIPF